MKRRFLFRWVLGLAILAVLLTRADFSGFGDATAGVDPALWISVIALNGVFALLATLRSQLVLRRLGHRVRTDLLFATMTLGFVAGSLTPAASGEVLRTDALSSKAGIHVRDGLALVVFERMLSFYFMSLVAAGLGAALFLPVLTATIAVAAVIALAFAPAFSSSLIRLIPEPGSAGTGRLSRGLAFLRSTASQVELIARDTVMLLAWSISTLVIFMTAGLQYWLLGQGVGDGLSYFEATFAYCSSQFLGIISLLPLGVGVSDGSLVAVTTHAGLSHDQAIAMAVLARATVTLPLIFAALASYAYLMFQRRTPEAEDQPAPARVARTDIAPDHVRS